jgi:hypothetical protein
MDRSFAANQKSKGKNQKAKMAGWAASAQRSTDVQGQVAQGKAGELVYWLQERCFP